MTGLQVILEAVWKVAVCYTLYCSYRSLQALLEAVEAIEKRHRLDHVYLASQQTAQDLIDLAKQRPA